jgi:hypothetical protein
VRHGSRPDQDEEQGNREQHAATKHATSRQQAATTTTTTSSSCIRNSEQIGKHESGTKKEQHKTKGERRKEQNRINKII